MRKLLLTLYAAVIFSACGSSQPASTIEIKFDGKEVPFVENEKSGWQNVQRALYSSGDHADRRHALRWITIRNYEIDGAAKTNSSSDKLTAPEQVKIFLSLHDAPGTDVTTPLKAASFKGDKSSGGPMNFELINVYTFRDGKEEYVQLYPSQTSDPAACEVKILSADDNIIKGEINVAAQKDGKDFIVKGPFTAQISKR